MNYAEALEHLHGLAVFGARFGLDTTRRMAAALANPQERLRFIHVAGTNGKGSTCAMLESVYRAAGFRVGLFTSPHLVSFRERMQVNRELISEADVARLVEEVFRAQCSAFGRESSHATTAESPTFFEFVTVMALKWFEEQRCDLVIWETGLGGRLDATNIVTPLASVITNIAFDHQQWLGNTLAKIAAEKAGIIKPGLPVLTAVDAPEALAVICETAERNRAPLTVVVSETSGETRQQPGERAMPRIGLRGEHQRRNAALAAAVVRALHSQLPADDAALCRGLESVQWAGRLQVEWIGDREFILDGAHNLDGVRTLVRALRDEFAGRPFALVVGVLADKDVELMCAELAPVASRIAAVRVTSNRSLPAEALAEMCRRASPGIPVSAHDSLAEALGALTAEPRVVIAGSLYLIGEALERLGLGTTSSERGLNEWQPGAKA